MTKECREVHDFFRGRKLANQERDSINRGPVRAVGCISGGEKEYLRLKLSISEENDDLSLVKGKRLRGSTRYDPRKKVKEILGTVKAEVLLGSNSIPFEFHLVNQLVDIPCDGVLERDFFLHTKAQICHDIENG